MEERNNYRLNEEIESHIRQWDGTIHGQFIKNMWENGSSYESICEAMGLDYGEWEDEAI